jgi:hypothetical protein
MDNYGHGTLILNVKEDGLEEQALAILREYGCSNYFFLDQPFPTIARSLKLGYKSAIRVSEYELPLRLLELRPQWLWIDSLTGNWSHLESAITYAKENDIRTCLVSPELQGREPEPEIDTQLMRHSQEIDSVCTKLPSLWNL